MKAIELINLIKPEHDRTSCSDKNITNGFYMSEDGEIISNDYSLGCIRCALLQIESGKVNLTEENNIAIVKVFI